MTKNSNYDVNPQIMNIFNEDVPQTTWTEAELSLPIGAVTPTKKQVIIEILKVWFLMESGQHTVNQTYEYFLSNKSVAATPEPTDPQVLAAAIDDSSITTSGAYGYWQPWCIDLTDGNGNGVLVASKKLYFGVEHTQGNSIDFHCKILYRFKSIDTQEFLGIVNI